MNLPMSLSRNLALQRQNTDAKPTICGTLVDQAQGLRQDTLRRQLDDLTRVWPVLQGGHGEKQRKKQLLCDQKLQGSILEGYQIAERRGLAFLAKEYQQLFMRHLKHRRRQEASAAGEMLTTGDDVDLEARYEQMRLSPLLIDATQKLTYQGMCSLSAAGKQFRRTFLDDLRRYANLVLEAVGKGWDKHADLSSHEEILGASFSHLDAIGALAKGRAVATRLVGKQAPQKRQ